MILLREKEIVGVGEKVREITGMVFGSRENHKYKWKEIPLKGRSGTGSFSVR